MIYCNKWSHLETAVFKTIKNMSFSCYVTSLTDLSDIKCSSFLQKFDSEIHYLKCLFLSI